jgi:hypothetical protein
MRGLLLFGLIFFSVMASAQYKAEEFQASLVEAKFGVMIVFNGQKNSFTLRIVSKAIEPSEQENFLLVDKKLIQASAIPFQEQFDFKAMNTEQQRELLTGYKEYEKEYLQKQLNTSLTGTEQFLNIEGRIFKYWSFDMPKGNASVSKQVYLFTICFDQILLLNGPVLKDQTEPEMKTLLVNMAKTLELFPDKTQDVRKLYFDLNN